MKKLCSDFFRCGVAGWCMEILFTSLHALRRRDRHLTGQTSLWMFPIYGSACLLRPVCLLLKKRPLLQRGVAYMLLIFSAEYWAGSRLQKKGLCPWDYGRSRLHIQNIIRLDYAPVWFLAGLLLERVLLPGKAPDASQTQLRFAARSRQRGARPRSGLRFLQIAHFPGPDVQRV